MPRSSDDSTAAVAALSARQQTALLALARGATQGEAATQAGVTRETVCRWLHDDPRFLAALHMARSDVWQASVDRLRLLGLKATEVLAQLLDSDDPRLRLAAVQTVLKAAGLELLEAPQGPTAVEDIVLARQSAAHKRRVAELLAEL